MRLDRVWLTDVRSYASAELELAPGLTALLGDNGQGKTNVLEAIGWLATLASFRGAPTEALIRQGAERAVIRAEGEREGRSILLEAELVGVGSQPGAGEPAAAQAGPRPARRAAGDRVRARRPRAGEGRPGRAPALPRRRAGGVPPPLRRAPRRGRQGPQAAQRPAQGRRRPARRRRRVHPRRVGRQARRVRRPPGRGPPGAARAAGAGAGRDLRRRRQPARPRSPPPTSADWAGVGLEAALAASRTRRPPPGRVHRRPAPRRRRPADRRPAGPHPRLAGRAAVAGPRAAPGVAPRDHRGHRQRAGAAARRRVLRARPGPQRRAPRQPPGGPDAPHQRQRPAPEGRPDLVLEVRDGRIGVARGRDARRESGRCPVARPRRRWPDARSTAAR